MGLCPTLRSAARHSAGIVAISHSVAESYLRRYHLPKDKMQMVYNGTDLHRFIPIRHIQTHPCG